MEANTKFTHIKDETDSLSDKYGILPLIVSDCDPESRTTDLPLKIGELTEEHSDKVVYLRARLQNKRMKKVGFLVLRNALDTVQCVVALGEHVSEQMFKFIDSIPPESIVDFHGLVRKSEQPINACTVKHLEIDIRSIFVVSAAAPVLPFQLGDANRKVDQALEEERTAIVIPEDPSNNPDLTEEEKKKIKNERKKLIKQAEKEEKKAKKNNSVGLKTRFDSRVLDFRVAASHSIIKVGSAVGQCFREFFINKGFVEVHSPKLIPGSSEGGADIFKINYFGKEACLAQSPQLYKQMCIAGDFPGVFEVGAVFRAEKSFTPRHLCEFTGLDFEMPFSKHYFEVVDVIGELFYYLIPKVQELCKKELETIDTQYSFEPIVLSEQFVKLSWDEGMELLKSGGCEHNPEEDLDTETERLLGELVKKKYNTDFFLLYGYPVDARPFYTMLDPKDKTRTLSYDAFIRGEEILSGAQRVHDYDMLVERIKSKGINPDGIKDYCDAFKLGCPPHGGAGLGLDRIVKLICGIRNVKRCTLFPRDPKRITP